MSGLRGTFAAVPTNAHHSPPLACLRLQLKPESDVYYYRALQFCKEYAKSGQLFGLWAAFATYANWPDSPDDICSAFRAAGVVLGPKDELWEWDRYNGFLIRRAAKEAKRKADARRAGKRSARARRARQLSLLPKPPAKRPQKRLPVPRKPRNG